MTENKLLGPPPIEPLSDLAWGRVERGLWSRMDGAPRTSREQPPKRWWPWLAAPLLAAAAAIAIFLAVRDTSPQHVAEERSRMVTNATPSALSFGDVYVALDAASAIEMRRASAQRQSVVLERGGAWFTVGERGKRPAFQVLAGDTTVRVVGTRFRVARSDEHVTVEVARGTVEIAFRGSTFQIRGSQRWSSERPEAVADVKLAVATPAPGPVPTRIDPKPAERTPARPRPARPIKPAKIEAAPPDEPAIAKPTKPEVVTVERERAAYERLVAVEVTDPARALTGYIALARGTTRWAEVALFAAGRLAADRKDLRARTLLTNYMRRFPAGANRDDARELLARLKGAP
ncbi:MAG: FecR family protein [Kofleriaceae bacterium]